MSTVDLIVPLASFSLLAAVLLTRAAHVLGMAIQLAAEVLRVAVRAAIAALVVTAMLLVLAILVARG
jgi:hypothetical protein